MSEMHHVPGVDMSTGSLGQGISAAVGMALAGKQSKKDYRVYALHGRRRDRRGSGLGGRHGRQPSIHLDNLCAVVDVNGLQIDGTTDDVMPSEPLDQKFEAFGWNVINDRRPRFRRRSTRRLRRRRPPKGQPTVILAKTVKGKGVSFMENNAGWHGKAPNDEQYAQAKAELEAAISGTGG